MIHTDGKNITMFRGQRNQSIRHRGWPLVACLTLATLAWTAWAMAADATTTAGPGDGAMPTFATLFMFSPWINGAVAALSILSVVLFLYFLPTLTTTSMAPSGFVDEVTKLVQARQYEETIQLCRSNRSIFMASIVQRCVENTSKGHGVVMEILDNEGRRRAEIVWNRISTLADISNLAPMLGLLGTVRGMIKAFFGLEGTTGSVKATALAQSIGEAMATTLFGLFLAILCLVFYSVIKGRVTRAMAEVEQIVHSIADRLQGDVSGSPANADAHDP